MLDCVEIPGSPQTSTTKHTHQPSDPDTSTASFLAPLTVVNNQERIRRVLRQSDGFSFTGVQRSESRIVRDLDRSNLDPVQIVLNPAAEESRSTLMAHLGRKSGRNNDSAVELEQRVGHTDLDSVLEWRRVGYDRSEERR